MTPITYTEAAALFIANGRRSFSFITAPYLVRKTAVWAKAHGLIAITPKEVN